MTTPIVFPAAAASAGSIRTAAMLRNRRDNSSLPDFAKAEVTSPSLGEPKHDNMRFAILDIIVGIVGKILQPRIFIMSVDGEPASEVDPASHRVN